MEALTPEVAATILSVVVSLVPIYIGYAHYQLRQEQKLLSSPQEQSVLGDFSAGRVTYQTPMALPGRGYSFSAKTQAEIVIPEVLRGGGASKWSFWRTEWRELPKISEER